MDLLREAVFGGGGGGRYAVLDGAASPALLSMLDRHKPEFCCLFRGELTQDVKETAPYLVRLERDAPFADWLLEEGWGRHWGIFALGDDDFRAMRKHFRTFLMVKRFDGKPMYFRYYDPRVLRAFLPTCDPEQVKVLFGSLEAYLLEGKDPGTLLRFEAKDGRAVLQELPLGGDRRAAGRSS